MPIYEYECNFCGHKLDKIQKFSDDPITTCPECREEKLEKVISAPGFRFKGDGWHETDYKDAKDRKNISQY